MDIIQFLEELKKIIEKIEKLVEELENSTNNGIQKMPELMERIQVLLPGWFYFIEQTGIGEKQEILKVLEDVAIGVEMQDGVILADALFCGLREIMLGYKEVIEDALCGE